MPRILVIEVAGLGWPLWERARGWMPHLARLAGESRLRQLLPPFPAVTVTAQATFTTGTLPRDHGMIANGLFHRELLKPMFWEQSAALVQGETIWQALKRRRPEATTATLCWQNAIGSGCDVVLTPAPIHKHGHGIIDSCYSVPADLYDRLAATLGPFRLRWYWGPFVSLKGSAWIARATIEVLRAFGPDLCLTYLPHLDYAQQRRGPEHPAVLEAAAATDRLAGDLVAAARALDYAVLVWGDYAIEPVSGFLSPNLLLREAGLLNVREVKGREYPDLGTSAAFAMVDHQVAHIYCLRGADTAARVKALVQAEGDDPLGVAIGRIIDVEGRGLDHPRAGEVVLEANPGCWFDYRWWCDGRAPDFAGHVDIHNKPGFDPCELFPAALGLRTSTDAARVRGSHGRQAPAVLVADAAVPLPPDEVVGLERLKEALLAALGG